MRSLVVAGVALAFAAMACDGDGDEPLSRDVQVYVAALRNVFEQQPPPPEPDILPVVYVVAVGETEIAATVQAAVASELHDEAEVRFADRRAEAVLADVEHVPVRDEGVLVALGELPADVDPVALEIEVYRSEVDWSELVLTFGERSSQWTVTSSSVVPDG